MAARPVNQDLLMSMRFHVTSATPGLGQIEIGSPQAGFMSVTTPEVTVESLTYKEGHYNFPRKYPGNTTVNDITMQRGVAVTDSTFWDWIKKVITGAGEYRTDLKIHHYDRRLLGRGADGASSSDNISRVTEGTAATAKVYNIKAAFPIRYKVASDLDASSSEVSISELDVSYNYFTIEATQWES